MAAGNLTQTYEPNGFFAYLYRQFFHHIHVDDAWLRAVRDAASRGSVVYVLRHVSFIDFLALDYLTKRFQLPQIRFVQDLGLGLFEPMGQGWWKALLPRRASEPVERLVDALSCGGSAALFLKRPPHLLQQARGGGRRGRASGDDLVRTLFRMQRSQERPILLLPQTFVWTKHPDERGNSVGDLLFGPREWPGKMRTMAQFFANYRHVDFRSGEELDLASFLRESKPGEDDESLTRRLTYTLLTRLERERRAILGPAQKPVDRVRHEVLRSPKLQSIIRDLSGDSAKEKAALIAKAYRMLRELEARPDPDAHRAYELILDVIVHRIYAGIEIDELGIEKVREAAKRGTVVFLPSHKSHVDYLLLSYVLKFAHIQLPLIAAGDNLAFFPMGPLFRRGGAFFIRRSFKGDRLYAAVVDAYLRRLVRDGWAVEFFLEGGRSRTGKLLPPKFGLLSMVCDAALSLPDRPVTFVPVSVGYDRIVEERSYARELTGGEKRKEDARSLLRSTRVLGGFYGRVNVQFGEPLTLPQIRQELALSPRGPLPPAHRRATVMRLAYRAMAEINRVTSVTPGAIVATVLLGGERRGTPHRELVEMSRRLVASLQGQGARMARSLVTPSGSLRPNAIREAAQLFSRGELVEVHVPGEGLEDDQRARAAIYTGEDVVYSVPNAKRLLLSLSKNIIVHFFVNRAFVSAAFATESDEHVRPEPLHERVQVLSRLFKHEFLFRADASFDRIFEETVAAMLHEGELVRLDDGALKYGPGHHHYSGRAWIRFYAEILRPFLEGYRVAARGATLLVKGPMAAKDLVKRSLTLGERMFLEGDIARREAVSRPLLENALVALQDQQFLHSREGKLALSPPFDSADTATALEARIQSFLSRLTDDAP